MVTSFSIKLLCNGDLYVLTGEESRVKVMFYPKFPDRLPGPISFDECPNKIQQAILDFYGNSKHISNS